MNETPNQLARPREPVRVTVLADNVVNSGGLLAEHGLAFWVETGCSRLLFDTGQGLVLEANARQLGLDLAELNAVALSHGHYDHTGGLADVFRVAAHEVSLCAHPEALAARFHCRAEGAREIGVPVGARESLGSPRCRLVLSRGLAEVAPGLALTGEIPRRHVQESIEEPFCLDGEGRRPDPLLDDQALFFRTEKGTVVLLGCAHAGVINTLEHVQCLTGGEPVRALIGGMHLRHTSEARLEWTLAALRRFDIQRLAPMHCTGTAAAVALWTAFPGRCLPGGVGTRFEF